jgi:hypothetical protein
MSDDPTPSSGDATPTSGAAAPPSNRMRAVLALGAAIVAVVAVVVWLQDGDDEVTTTDATTTTSAPDVTTTTVADATTTEATTTSEATTSPPVVDTTTAVYPWADSSRRFADPVDAASSFATEFVGFRDPVVGEFMQGDSRSGEVEIRPAATGPVTTVFVRQLGADDTWWVLGCATANIEVTGPDALATISSPVTLEGRANAFEGNVNVEVRVDGERDALTEDFVTGMMGEMGPFSKAVPFPDPGTERGALVFRTLSAEDGSVWEAGVLRVSFG